MPNYKVILEELDHLIKKRNTLMQEYSSSKQDMDDLYQIRKNFEKYMGKEMERWRDGEMTNSPSPFDYHI